MIMILLVVGVFLLSGLIVLFCGYQIAKEKKAELGRFYMSVVYIMCILALISMFSNIEIDVLGIATFLMYTFALGIMFRYGKPYIRVMLVVGVILAGAIVYMPYGHEKLDAAMFTIGNILLAASALLLKYNR